MYTYDVFIIGQLPPGEIKALSTLQHPVLKSAPTPLDLFDPENRQLIAISAKCDQKPVALLLARLLPKQKIGEVASLFVLPEHRRNKVASHLLELLKEKSKKEKLKQIGLVYPSSVPDTPFLEEFLKKNGFGHKLFMTAEFQFEYSQFTPSWFLRQYQWPKDFEVFPWGELTWEDRETIKLKYSKGIIPFDVNPLARPGIFEPLNSLGLRHKGNIIGWVLNERVQQDTINYRNMYIDYDYQYRGFSIYLLVESLNIHKQNQIRWGMFQVSIPNSSGKWLRFIRHRLAPYANFIYEYAVQTFLIN